MTQGIHRSDCSHRHQTLSGSNGGLAFGLAKASHSAVTAITDSPQSLPLGFLSVTEIQSSRHVKSSLAIPPRRYIPPKLAQEMGATGQASVYWPSRKGPLPKSPHRYDPEIKKRLIAAVRAFRSF